MAFSYTNRSNMARSMKVVTVKCACCGNKQTIEKVEYTPSQDSELHLMEYMDFKYIPCNVCTNCGYVSKNIDLLLGAKTRQIVASEVYKRIHDYGFIEGYKDLGYNEYLETNIGDLDAMELLYEAEGKSNLTFARLNSRIAEIKTSLRGEYTENMYQLDDDDPEFKLYSKLISNLTEQIDDATKKCYETLIKLDLKGPYEILFAAEVLTRVNAYAKARKLVSNLKKNYTFDGELNRYVNNFLTEVEVI